MRARLIPLFVFLAAAASACGGSKGGGGGNEVTAGTYLISNGVTQTDSCDVLGDLSQTNGTTFQISNVSASSITFTFPSQTPFAVTRSGTTFSATSTADMDWTSAGNGLSQPYNCMEHDLFSFTGSITASNHVSITEDIQYTDTSGTAADCLAAVNSAYTATVTTWPCQSRGSFNGAKQ